MGVLESDLLQIRVLIFAGNMISGNCSDLSVPQFPHLMTVMTVMAVPPHRVTMMTNESIDVKLIPRPDPRMSPVTASSSVMRTAAATRIVTEEDVKTQAV